MQAHKNYSANLLVNISYINLFSAIVAKISNIDLGLSILKLILFV